MRWVWQNGKTAMIGSCSRIIALQCSTNTWISIWKMLMIGNANPQKRFRQALCPTLNVRAIILYPSTPKLLNPNTFLSF